MPIFQGKALYRVSIEVQLEAALRVEQPPMVSLDHHPEREEKFTQEVKLYRPGTSRTVSETVHVSQSGRDHHAASDLGEPFHSRGHRYQGCDRNGDPRGARAGRGYREGSHDHDEERAPGDDLKHRRSTTRSWLSGYPKPEPVPEPATQTPGDLDELKKLFEILGWEWPW